MEPEYHYKTSREFARTAGRSAGMGAALFFLAIPVMFVVVLIVGAIGALL